MTNNDHPLIRINNLVKTFKTAAGEVTVLKGINVNFYRGEFVGIIGKSGSGKTTLINMITGIDRPTSGEIFVEEIPIHSLSENEMAIWRGKNIGIVFQFFQLLPMLSLLENVMLPMDFCDLYSPRERRDRALHLLDLVELAEHADKLPSAISGGQQQRVAIARAMANDPPILLADEPTGNLDSTSANIVFQMFENLVKDGKTIIMVTHDSSQARRVDRTFLIADGEIVNEYVAKALPLLDHQLMLEATHNLQPIQYKPGETILREGDRPEKFYIVTQGIAEVVLTIPGGAEVIVNEMKTGQFFGEIELLKGGTNKATIRASVHTPVEVVALDKEIFESLITHSDALRASISKLAEDRLSENIQARQNQI